LFHGMYHNIRSNLNVFFFEALFFIKLNYSKIHEN
jgi:hypothetical protein